MADSILDWLYRTIVNDTVFLTLVLCSIGCVVFSIFGAIEILFLRLAERFRWLRLPRWLLPQERR